MRNTHCPECNQRLVLQAFWQGHLVNCTSCGAKLQRSRSGMIFSAVAGILAWFLADWLLTRAGAPMELEIAGSLIALAAGYGAVHVITLDLKPWEDETSLKL